MSPWTAEGGDDIGEYDLGIMYEKGFAVSRNMQTAYKWFRMAAHGKYALAENQLALMYARGVGTRANHRKALKWFRMASSQGYHPASYNLKAIGNKWSKDNGG